jgi:hypothetical protein
VFIQFGGWWGSNSLSSVETRILQNVTQGLGHGQILWDEWHVLLSMALNLQVPRKMRILGAQERHYCMALVVNSPSNWHSLAIIRSLFREPSHCQCSVCWSSVRAPSTVIFAIFAHKGLRTVTLVQNRTLSIVVSMKITERADLSGSIFVLCSVSASLNPSWDSD